MNRRVSIAVFATVILAALLAAPSSADFYRARVLAQHARAFEVMIRSNFRGEEWNPVDAGAFMGYVAGVTDALGDQLDLDEEVDVTQVCSVVAKYLRDHPRVWNLPAGEVCRDALIEAFGRTRKQ